MEERKKAALIGRFNKITEEIGKRLSSICENKFCPSNDKIMDSVLDAAQADIFVIVFTGMSCDSDYAIRFLLAKYPRTPVIAVGSKFDEENLSSQGLLTSEGICFLRTPVDMNRIEECVRRILSIPKSESKSKANEAKNSSVGKSVQRQPLVLVVDDSQQQLLAMQSLLSKKYKVSFALSGTKAIAEIAKNPPDIILLDYEMPVCDGRQTLEMLRSENDTKDIPVIFLTGVSDKEHIMEVLKLRPEGYLLKSCSEARLFSTIDDVLLGKSLIPIDDEGEINFQKALSQLENL